MISDNKARIVNILAEDISYSEKVSKIYHSDFDKNDTLEICCSVQNKNGFDFFEPFFEASTSDDIENFFTVRNFVGKLIPNSKLSNQKIFELIDKMVTLAGQDLAANLPLDNLVEWLDKHIEHAQYSLRKALSGSHLEKKYFMQIIQVTQDKDSAILMACSSDEESIVTGIRALSRIIFSDSCEARECLNKICDVDFNEISDAHSAAIIFCAYSIFEKFHEESESFLLDIIDKTNTNEDSIITNYELVRLLSNLGDNLSISTIGRILNKILKFNHENRGTLDILDYCLSKLWLRGQYDFVNNFILNLDKENKSKFTFKNYPHLETSIYSSTNDVFCTQVVFLFNTKNFTLCVAAKDLMSEFIMHSRGDDFVDLDFNLNSQEVIYFCKKIVGFLFIHPKVITKILLNAMRRMKLLGEEKIVCEICDILFDPVMTNYGSPIEICEKLTDDDVIFDSVSNVIEKIRNFLDGLKASDKVKELSPSEIERFIERDLRARDFEKATKEARKKSVFLDLVSHVSLLYGKSCISIFKGMSGDTSVTTNSLSTISQMAELPRCEIWDKVALNKMLFDLRHEDLDN